MDVSTNSQLTERVMRRVRFVRTARMLTSGYIGASLLFVLALWGIGREVWVAKVFQNMPSLTRVGDVARFFLLAFAHTHLSVQILCLAALAAVLWLLRDISRTVVTQVHHFA